MNFVRAIEKYGQFFIEAHRTGKNHVGKSASMEAIRANRPQESSETKACMLVDISASSYSCQEHKFELNSNLLQFWRWLVIRHAGHAK